MKVFKINPADGIVTKVVGEEIVLPKSVYSNDEFMAKLGPTAYNNIVTAGAANPEIAFWVFQIQMVKEIRLDALPQWFEDGVAKMVEIELFGVDSQSVVDTFLER